MSAGLISLPFYNCLIIISVLLTAIVNGGLMVPRQKTGLPAMTSIASAHQCVAIVHLSQTLINVLAAFAYITSR